MITVDVEQALACQREPEAFDQPGESPRLRALCAERRNLAKRRRRPAA